jgi:polar amino acid transport system substrate-binding protein
MKGLLALAAASALLWSWPGLNAATTPRPSNITDVALVVAAASAPAITHGARAAEMPATAKASAIAEGHSLFNDNCEHCHGPDAVQAIEERNLRHLALRYGNKMDQVFMYTVTHGRPSKGMPNWSGILTRAQFRNILAYLHSIQQN